ncbi:hypothetical protein [Parasphingorhabdus litoris]|uniref:hypothetical protein n=1 Tax=Parasphingorhabdus litoris TaxID=394733 RepID=UPI0031E42F0B
MLNNLSSPYGPAKPAKPAERGYILITAVWMLLLGASIVAVIMIHNLRASEELSFEREQAHIRYAQESAIETVVADILFNGPRSQLARLPAETNYTINGVAMQIRVSSESGKIDVNQADPILIERALRGFGIPGSQRQAFLAIIAGERSASRLFQSPADVAAAMQQAGLAAGSSFCPDKYFTTFSGLGQPVAGQMRSELAKALGQPSLPTEARARPGTALRISVATDGASPRTAVIRTSGLIGQAYSVLDWSDQVGCEQ